MTTKNQLQLFDALRESRFEDLFEIVHDAQYAQLFSQAIEDNEGRHPWAAAVLSYGMSIFQSLGPRALVGMFAIGVAIGLRAGLKANEIEQELSKMSLSETEPVKE